MTTDFLNALQTCLGGPWPEPGPLHAALVETRQIDDITLQLWSYEVEPGERVSAWLLLPPDSAENKKRAGVLVWHQHNGEWHLGKSEPAGLAGNPMHHTGLALAKRGYITLCPDALCFEDRRHPKLAGGNYERFEFLRYVVDGKCLAWKYILDMRRAVDFLVTRAEVDAERLGCYGHSMGSTCTWLVGPWEPRIRCLVGNCCLPTYAGIHREGMLHCFPNFVPGLERLGDTPAVVAAIAPKPLLLNFGETDRGSPVADLPAAIQKIEQSYKDQSAGDNFSAFIEPGVGHVLSEAMWQRTLSWFDRHLKSPT